MSEPPTPRPIDDRELVLTTIALTAERATAAQRGEASGPELPHPVRTDHNLGHYVGVATSSQGRVPDRSQGRVPDRSQGRPSWDTLQRIRRRLGLADQARYNDAVVNALHQLDHRTQLQSRRIAKLEAELAEARRAIADLS